MLLATFLFLILTNVKGQSPPRYYNEDDVVPALVSNIAPFHNPTERYSYDRLPWPCKLTHSHREHPGLGSIIAGERNRDSLYKIHFLKTTTKQTLCSDRSLDEHAVKEFIRAIKNEYQYEMWIDDLPVYGRVGFMQRDPIKNIDQYYLITHRHYHLQYNKNQIITANISGRLHTGHYIQLEKGVPISNIAFTYEVSWSKTKIPYVDRWNAQTASHPTRYQVEAHWLWVLNSSY